MKLYSVSATSKVNLYDVGLREHNRVDAMMLIPDSLRSRRLLPRWCRFYNSNEFEFRYLTGDRYVDTIINGEDARLYTDKSLWATSANFTTKSISEPITTRLVEKVNFPFIWKHDDTGWLVVPNPDEEFMEPPQSFPVAIVNESGVTKKVIAEKVPISMWPEDQRSTTSIGDTVFVSKSTGEWLRLTSNGRMTSMPNCAPMSQRWDLVSITSQSNKILLTYHSLDRKRFVSVITNVNGIRLSPYYSHMQDDFPMLILVDGEVNLLLARVENSKLHSFLYSRFTF